MRLQVSPGQRVAVEVAMQEVLCSERGSVPTYEVAGEGWLHPRMQACGVS
jgi:hypothetical protein